MKGKLTPLFPDGEVAIPWLDTLREATGYNLTVEQEARCVEVVDELGLPDNIVLATAEAVVNVWPDKRYKRLDMTFRNWLRREYERRPKVNATNDAAIRAYVERQRQRGTLPGQRKKA